MGVSRETESPPESLVRHYFGVDRGIHRFVDLLTTVGVERGLVGPREADRIWTRHILNCAAVESTLPNGASVIDVGSGAGLPGLVLALARPDLTMTLLEPLLRRATFLTEVVDILGLPQVEVVRARAEDLASSQPFDVATARAVAPLHRLVPWALPLCRSGGELVALKGSSAATEIAEAAEAIAAYGGQNARIETVGDGLVEPPPTVVRIESTGQVGPIRKGRR